MTITEIRELVSSRLPGRYAPLQLTFYGQESRLKGGHVIIGDDYGTDLCVRLSDGAVYSIDPKDELPTRFVNSGIEQLAKFIEVSESFSKVAGDSAVISQSMRAVPAKIDPKPFSDSESWWSVVLEQMADGS
jgi:hypothetical protein